MLSLHKIIATFFGLGFIPLAPGTFGALGGLLVSYALIQADITYSLFHGITVGLIILFTLLGTWSTNHLEKLWGKDPGKVVVDEAIGFWVSILFAPLTIWSLSLGFIFFRIFDIWKPLGIRSLEKIPGGFGVMADDLLAGVYAAISLQIILTFTSI